MPMASRKGYSSNVVSPKERGRISYHRDSITISFEYGLLEKACEGGQPSYATLVGTLQYKSYRSYFYMIVNKNKIGCILDYSNSRVGKIHDSQKLVFLCRVIGDLLKIVMHLPGTNEQPFGASQRIRSNQKLPCRFGQKKVGSMLLPPIQISWACLEALRKAI